eukprot:35907-Ditylum_brightwellii.AAC.1
MQMFTALGMKERVRFTKMTQFMAVTRMPDNVVFPHDNDNLWLADISDLSKVGWKKTNHVGQAQTN